MPGPTICQLAVLPALSIGTLPAIVEATRALNLWNCALPGTSPYFDPIPMISAVIIFIDLAWSLALPLTIAYFVFVSWLLLSLWLLSLLFL